MTVFSLPPFEDQQLWKQAITHRSFANEQTDVVNHNERLEFLGDAILTFISGEYLYQRYPQRPEGELTPLRAALVDESQLCHFAQQLGLGRFLRLGKGAEQEGSRQSRRLLCSTFEAMIGAYFLDTGRNVATVRDYVVPMFDTVIEQAATAGINPKSQLQEWTQKGFGTTPEYVILSSNGPDHQKSFVVEVQIGGKSFGQGRGHSKKVAEKAAARVTLAMLDEEIN